MPLTMCSSAAASTMRLLRGGVSRSVLGGSLGGLLSLLRRGRLHNRLLRSIDHVGGLLIGSLEGALGVLVALELAPVARDLEDRGDLLGRLSADGEPVLGTLGIDLDERGLLGGVVLTDLFDDTTVALGARVGDDDAVVGRADLTQALQTDLDSHDSPSG